MMGIMFNVVKDVVTKALSDDAWDDVIDSAGISGSYTSLGNYPDGDFHAMVAAAAVAAGLSEEDTLRLSGREGFKHLVRRAQHLLAGVDDWKAVVTSLNDIIHPIVHKIYPDAVVPMFETVPDGDTLLVIYTSERGLCALADGLILGCGDWFDVELSVEHLTCVHQGEASCTMRVAEAG
ncbi:MAG: hypothetical protein ACI9N0_001554 [Ilumatobacter sp.]|jgi:hypothetical protein